MKRLSCSLLLLVSCLNSSLRADAVVGFNEIMYHPATTETTMEWVELRNFLAVDIDISDWAVSGAINYTFPSNTIIHGRGYLVLALSPSTISAITGLPGILGPFSGRLGNNGETLTLKNNSGRIIDELTYGVEDDWPVAPDGSGASLAKRDADSASDPAQNWVASEQLGGTPGAANFVTTTGFIAPPGLVSYWSFNESGTTALDQAGQNHGALGAGATRSAGGIGGGISFNATSAAYVNAGPGVNNNFAVANGITIEAVLQSTWNGTGTSTLFRKAPAPPTNYNGAVLASDPIAYWRLNDTTTAILDSTANARNGTATAGAQLNQSSLVPTDPGNGSIRVNGTERVLVSGFEKIGAGGYTVEYWVKPNALPTGCCQNLVGDGESAGDYFMMNYILGPAQGTVGAIRPHFGPGNSPVSLTGSTALQAGSAYHIATTWDPTKATDNAVIYINGMASTVGTISRIVPTAGTTGANPVYIGKDNRDTTDGDNTIDEVAIYNRALSGADIATHYFAGTAVNFAQNQGNAIQLAFQNDGNNAQANPPVAAGPVLSFGLTVGGVYSELDMPLDGQSGRPTLAQLQNGQLHHISASYNPATGEKAIYIDGTLRFSTTLAGSLNANNLVAAIIGNSVENGTAPFAGLIDEVAYWGKALSSSEVAAHFTAVQAGRDYFTPVVETASTTLAFSEFSSPTNNPFFVEIQNYGSAPIALTNFSLRHDGTVDHVYNFPATSLAPGAYLAVTAANLGFTPVSGDKFYLSQNSSGRVVDAVVIKNRGRSRSPQITSPWAFSSVPTPGAANTVNFRSEIVINEIMYNHAVLPGTNGLPPRQSPEAWIELYNRSANPVNLTGWELGGGISYVFTPGQVIPAGGYLVIADDVPYLKALYPSINIVGDFGGRLSGKTDRIVLRDSAGNTADEVRYFDGGNWPRYADGGGSSLELRDPNSDNSKAEAWADSDETGKTTWQTISYRMVANIPNGSGQPTTWQDFVLGLQSAGECLIDDLSVIETPATTPVEIISNGNFDSGLTGWRVLGTHGRSQVVPEPGNPGNNVLRIVATGPQEHMHNHIERTLNAGRTIVNGREYQVSYRARWLAGNNLLNTRLYFNRAARTVALPMAPLNGTPGAQNSQFVANAGPTFSDFGHQRVVPQPGESVTVNVSAEDPQGVTACEVFWSVNSGAWASAAMTHQGGGAYTGTIPGQGVGAVVQFYVRAVDSLGAAATYPARGTNSGALFKVADGQANLSIAHNVRIILTPSNIDLLHGTAQGVNQTNVMSNDLLPCTVIYDEQRAYYDCGVHLRGSQRGRYSDVRTGFHINFPPDDLFRGVHPVMLVDRSGAGDATANRQEDIVVRHILNRAGNIPGTYSEICRLLAPRTNHLGSAQFFPRHEDHFIETAFENGNDGQMFEMELIYYPTTANAVGYKNPQPDAVVGTDITNLGDDKEIYRYNFMLKNGRDVDDYSRFITLSKAWSLTGAALDAQTKELMDIDQWMRAYSIVSLCGIGDTYTFGNNHNFFTYMRPSDGKFVFFPWDMDFSFVRGTGDPLVGDQNLGKIVNLPGNLRVLYAHMLDIIDISFNSSYMTYWVNHYETFAPGQDYTPRAAYIQNRANFARSTINTQTGTGFTVAGATEITTANNLVTLSGTAAAAVRTITINGIAYPVTWTAVNTWRILIPVTEASNVLNIVSYDVRGRPLTNFNRTITVNYTGPTPDPSGAIVINEIMYNPVTPDTAYIELFNTSSNFSFDLSGWRLNGVDYTFPDGSIITNRQIVAIAANPVAYVATYGTNTPAPYGQFIGNLQNDGETISLLRPGTTAGTEIVMDQVRYESVPAWPTKPNGTGPSLQLIDAAQDNSRVSNWSDSSGWRFYSFTGPPGANALNLWLFLASAGELYVDNVSIVEGAVAGVGTNYVENGDLETGVLGPWIPRGNHTNTSVSSAVAYSGSYSLKIVSVGAGGTGQLVDHAIPLLNTNNTYTFSFWYLPSTNGSGVSFRVNSVFRNGNFPIDYRPIPFTPGLANSVRAVLPVFPDLWINEALPQNLTGIADNQGEREPWIELHNSGATPISLAGCYLANNYSNITQWAFPAGATLQPGEFKTVFADNEPGESTASEWHASFRLNAGAGSVILTWSPGGGAQILDYLNYTNIPPGRSYGSYPDGQSIGRQEFYVVTPGATNDNTAAPIVVYINEWMAANTSGLLNTNNGNRFDDWVELYNPGSTPANLAGYYLSDNLANKTQFKIPPGYVIPPQSYFLIWADGEAQLNNTNTDPVLHVSFRLSQDGEAIGLFAGDGTTIDSVDFRTEAQFNNISQGRFPDGPNSTYYLATSTPLAANSSWANRYPVLTPIGNYNAFVGQPLVVNITASDPDVPAQTLTYSLVSATPTGAVINATSGQFTWTPSAIQTPSTNIVTVRVTDNGTPALSRTGTFTIVAGVGFQVSGVALQPNGNFGFTIGATVGKRYRVEYKTNLSDPEWTPLIPDTGPAASNSIPVSDPIGANQQRFYRVVQLN